MRWFKVLLSGLLILNFIGCATTGRNRTELEIAQLQTKINDLEEELQLQQDQIQDLQYELQKRERKETSTLAAALPASGAVTGVSKPTSKNVQQALKNAGFYTGAIDGKIGPKTREAIKEFQKSNSLYSDGIVGKKTWEKLSQYLY